MLYSLSRMIGEANECLFKLREPLAKFLAKVLPPVINMKNWENAIFETIREKNNYKRDVIIESFYDLDMSMLIYILVKYFNELKQVYNSLAKEEYYQYYGKFNDNYLTHSIKKHRNAIAHPNNSTLNIGRMDNILKDFINFGKYIGADDEIVRSIEVIRSKYTKYQSNTENERKKNERIIFIEDNVIRPALNSEKLVDDIKDSVLTTLFRIKNKKTFNDIDVFFTEAQGLERGIEIKNALNKVGLLAFEDIAEEYMKKFM